VYLWCSGGVYGVLGELRIFKGYLRTEQHCLGSMVVAVAAMAGAMRSPGCSAAS